MNNEFKAGDWVLYVGASDEQVRWGGNADPRGILKSRSLYTLARVEVHRQHTKLFLEGIPNLGFNSVHFNPS